MPIARAEALRLGGAASGDKSNRGPMHTIALEREVRRRVGAGQVKVDDVACLCDLKQAAGPIGLRKGASPVHVLSLARPYLRDRVRVTIEVREAAKWPVAADADHDEVRSVRSVEISMDHNVAKHMLLDPGHSLDGRILGAQFGYWECRFSLRWPPMLNRALTAKL